MASTRVFVTPAGVGQASAAVTLDAGAPVVVVTNALASRTPSATVRSAKAALVSVSQPESTEAAGAPQTNASERSESTGAHAVEDSGDRMQPRALANAELVPALATSLHGLDGISPIAEALLKTLAGKARTGRLDELTALELLHKAVLL
jgi:hypothetical protein